MYIGRALILARKVTKNNTICMRKHTNTILRCVCAYIKHKFPLRRFTRENSRKRKFSLITSFRFLV